MTQYKFASVLISTLNKHEYYYGDTEMVEIVSNNAYKEITNPKLERVNIRYHHDESKMLEYIEQKKKFFTDVEGSSSGITFKCLQASDKSELLTPVVQ